MTRPRWDPTITLGHILTAATMLGAIVGGWATLDKRVSLLEQRMDAQEQTTREGIERVAKDVAEMRQDIKQLIRRGGN